MIGTAMATATRTPKVHLTADESRRGACRPQGASREVTWEDSPPDDFTAFPMNDLRETPRAVLRRPLACFYEPRRRGTPDHLGVKAMLFNCPPRSSRASRRAASSVSIARRSPSTNKPVGVTSSGLHAAVLMAPRSRRSSVCSSNPGGNLKSSDTWYVGIPSSIVNRSPQLERKRLKVTGGANPS
jgi:hypothetical protein